MGNFWKTLDKPITALAPMEEVTDYVFREIVTSTAKPDILFTEFTSTESLYSKGHDRTARKLEYSKAQRPVVAQIWGSNPKNFEKSARFIEERGLDGIDINMGCPDRAVMKTNSGASLINKKSLVSEIINAVKSGSPKLPLSVKTRLDSNEKLTTDWFSFLLSCPINALIIHGRDAKSMSKGSVNWNEIEKAVNLKNQINKDVIILGNGDVKSYKEILNIRDKYGVDGVMIGRGIFQNPWIFDKNDNPTEHSKKDYLELLIKHTNMFNEKWGKSKNFEIMKKFFKVYVKGFRGADNLRSKLMLTKSYEEFQLTISQYLL